MKNIIHLTDGFFDLKINESLPIFRNKYNNEYELIRETKRLFDNVSHKFIGQNATENNLYLASAMIDLSKLFQSAVILFERGLPESGNIIIRSCLELSFKIVELIKNPNFVDDMKKELNSENRSTLNIIQGKELYDVIPKDTVEELLNKFNSEKNKFKISVFQLAEKNNLMQAYILYRLYCNDSHQSISTLSEIQVFEDNGVHLNGNLRLDKFSESIYMLISIATIPFLTLIEERLIDDELKKQYDSFYEKFQSYFEEGNA